jgi:hypothetical protein
MSIREEVVKVIPRPSTRSSSIEEDKEVRILVFGVITFLVTTACGTTSPQSVHPTASSAAPTTSPMLLPTAQPTTTQDAVRQAQQAALLYRQDFENDSADGLYDFGLGVWNLIAEDDGNHIYCNEASSDGLVVNFGADMWTDYAVEMRVNEVDAKRDPYFSLYARFERHKYLMYYGALNFVTQAADLAYNEPYRSLGHKDYPVEDNSWHTLRMEVAETQISFYINDLLIGSADDSQRPQGKAGFSVSPGLEVCVDDIRVWALDENGQIARLPVEPEPRSLSDRLASHEFPRLFYQNQDNDPTNEALTPAFHWDILTFSEEVAKSGWVFLGPSGLIRLQNPNAVILVTLTIQEFFPDDSSVTGKAFVSGLRPDWVMHDIHGNPFSIFYYGNGYWSTMINLATDVNTYIPRYLNENAMKTGLWDGVFYDGTNEAWWQADPFLDTPSGPIDFNNDGKADTTAELTAAQDAGLRRLLNETRRTFPGDSLITGNGGWDGALLLDGNAKTDTILAGLLNGRMIEGFLNWERYGIGWLESMRAYYLMQQASVEPRTPFIMAYCTGTDYDHLRYTLASALMFDAYFTCTNAQDGEAPAPYTANWWYDEYSVELSTGKAVQSLEAKGYLGMPITDAYNVDDKNSMLATLLVNNDRNAERAVWRRDFQNGSVLVNPSGTSMDVDLDGTYRKVLGIHDPRVNDGSQVTKITLPPKSGVILLDPP